MVYLKNLSAKINLQLNLYVYIFFFTIITIFTKCVKVFKKNTYIYIFH